MSDRQYLLGVPELDMEFLEDSIAEIANNFTLQLMSVWISFADITHRWAMFMKEEVTGIRLVTNHG